MPGRIGTPTVDVRNGRIPGNPLNCVKVPDAIEVVFAGPVHLKILAAGTLTVRPAGSDSDADIPVTVAAGAVPYVLEYQVSIVRAGHTLGAGNLEAIY